MEGQNIVIETRWAESQYDQMPALTEELLDRKVAVIAALGNVAARARKAAASTIPVVLVTSLNRPGTNITGVSILNNELESKRLELADGGCSASQDDRLSREPGQSNDCAEAAQSCRVPRALGHQLHVLNARSEHASSGRFSLRSIVAAFALPRSEQSHRTG